MKSLTKKLKIIFSAVYIIAFLSSFSLSIKVNQDFNKQGYRVVEKKLNQDVPVNNEKPKTTNTPTDQISGTTIRTALPGTMKSPVIDTSRKIHGNERNYAAVTYVKELSPAGKASLELHTSGDPEYIKLIENGFESPHFTSRIVENKPIPVAAPANVNYLWQSNDPRDANLWQNVEFNRYNNRLLDTTRYSTPAHFTISETGNTVVHAPSDHGLQITAPATTTLTSSNTFLDLEDIIDMNQDSMSDEYSDVDLDEHIKNYYSFLDD